jgi:hypothetical protein
MIGNLKSFLMLENKKPWKKQRLRNLHLPGFLIVFDLREMEYSKSPSSWL